MNIKKVSLFLCMAIALVMVGCRPDDPTPDGYDSSRQHEYVDLGLSVKWSTCNVGAADMYSAGDFIAWGDTTDQRDESGLLLSYTWDIYRFCTEDDTDNHDTFTKYVAPGEHGPYGVPDGLNVLEPEDDAATYQWGPEWRMPTLAEWLELRDKCKWEYVEINKNRYFKVSRFVHGVTKYILLPMDGRQGVGKEDPEHGFYWSSTLYEGYCGNAYGMFFYRDEKGAMTDTYGWNGPRYLGCLIRPVYAVGK